MAINERMMEERPQVSALLRVIPSSNQRLFYIYNPVDRTVKVANVITKRVLDLCDGSRSLAEIVSALAREFDEDVSVIQADVQALLETLRREGLLA